MQAAEISRTALDVEWRRLEVVAQNLANANTARTASGEPYQAMQLLSGPKVDFQHLLSDAGGTKDLQGVAVYGFAPMNLPPRQVYEPGNPQADANGFVLYPGYDQAEQMTQMLKAERVYEANVAALSTARQMYMRALQVGSSS